MFVRALLAVSALAVCYWALGTFALLRRRGLPHALRWVLAVLLALWVGGFIAPIR